MPIMLGLDLGTTKIGAVAVEASTGRVLAAAALANDAEITSTPDRARGRSEWDAERMAERGAEALRACAESLGPRRAEIVGLGLTGQQHGVVLIGEDLAPLGPFLNWQDRRGDEARPGPAPTWVEYARERAGAEAAERAGCRLATGYMGATLFWLQETQGLPERATACFVTEFLAAWLTGRPPLTEPTMAASSGLLDLRTRDWNVELLARLGLPRTLFPAVGEAGDPAGELSATAAESCGLPAGLPIFVGLGDMQAAFLGSVAEPATTVAVNVGTGAQVMRYAEQVFSAPSLETRPFPRQGYLLTHAGLAGGAAYATLERFFAAVAREVLHVEPTEALYAQMNALAQSAPPGCAGLRCEPVFAGSREDPELRGSWTGISEQNFTPATFVRALLEGLARGLGEGYASTVRALGTPARRLVGAGNGLRENRLLAALVAEELGLPLQVPAHREEAAYGAALVAGFGAGLWPDLGTAARVIQYEQE